MKVWVRMTAPAAHGGKDVYLSLAEPRQGFGEGLEEQEVEGAESKVLVDREELRHVLEHSGASGSRSSWCNWPNCEWNNESGSEHTGNCPLRVEA